MHMALGRGREARRDAAYAALTGGDLAGRLGAVYALVELADEWLGEVSLPVGVRRGHVQGVIDRLCAYLRSPLNTAADNGAVGAGVEEGRIQRAIVAEIHRRVQYPVASAEGASLAGAWSGFAFNFSGAVFVCTVNFTGSRWEHEVDFSDCIFMRDVLFSCSTFAGTANFAHSTYRALADFSESLYQDAAYFGGCTWGGAVNFSGCTFRAGAYFLGCRYGADTVFTGCSFAGTVVMMYSAYRGAFTATGCTFAGDADLSSSAYYGPASLRGCVFLADAWFGGGSWGGRTVFSGSVFEGAADFSGAAYLADAIFTDAVFVNCAPSLRGCVFSPRSVQEFTRTPEQGHPIVLDGGLPVGSHMLTPGQLARLAKLRQKVTQRREQLADKPAGSAAHRRAARRLEQAHEAFARWAHGLTAD